MGGGRKLRLKLQVVGWALDIIHSLLFFFFFNAREFSFFFFLIWVFKKYTYFKHTKNIDLNIRDPSFNIIYVAIFRSLQHFISWGKKTFSLCNWQNKEIIGIYNIVLCVLKFHRNDILSVVSLHICCIIYLTYVSISLNDYQNLFLHF